MRDIVKYPITTDEIIAVLTRLRERERASIMESGRIGDITVLVIDDAIERLHRLESLMF